MLTVLSNKTESHPGGRFSISDRSAPTRDERDALMAPRGAVAKTLEPGDDAAIGDLISAMMMGFGGARHSTEEAKRTVALYVSQLRRFPVWAVKAACEAAMRSGSSFAPSVANLVKGAEDAISEPYRELAKINRVLNADIYHEPTAEERERVKRDFQTVVDDLKLQIEPDRADRKPALTREDYRRIVDDMHADPVPLPAMSDRLRAMYGRKGE